MTKPITVILLLLLAVGLTWFLAFGDEPLGSGPTPEGSGTATVEKPAPLKAGEPGAAAGEKGDGVKRRELEGAGPDAGAPKVTSGRKRRIQGQVADEFGAPLAGVVVTVGPAREGGVLAWAEGARGARRAEGLRTETGADGAWSLTTDRFGDTGRIRVTATRSGYLPRHVQVPLSAEDPLVVPEIKLERGATIVGTVRDEGGNPVAEAEVRVDGARLSPGGAGRTDKTGRYTLEGVKKGRHRIHVDAKGFALAYRQVEVTEVGVPLQVDFRLGRGLSIAGVVVDAGGAPVAEASVQLVRERSTGGVSMITQSAAESTKTDKEGAFRLANLEKGSFQVRVGAEGFLGGTLTKVKAGTQGLRVTLDRGGSVVGVLVLPDGKPAPRFTVKRQSLGTRAGDLPPAATRLLSRSVRGAKEFGPEAKGAFELAGLRPGPLALIFQVEGYPDRQVPVRILEGQTTRVGTVRMVRGGWIDLQVLDAAGKPVAGAKVEAVPVGSEQDVRVLSGPGVPDRVRRTARRAVAGAGGGVIFADTGVTRVETDGEGRCRLSGLAAGAYTVEGKHEDHAPGSVGPVQVPAGGGATAELRLPAGGAIDVVLRDRQGNPVAGQDIGVIPDGAGGMAGPRAGKTDAEGIARFDHLPPGRYKVGISRTMRLTMAGGVQVALPLPRMDQRKTACTVGEGRRTRVELTRPEPWKVEGTVVDGNGPVAGARLRLVPAGGAALPGLDGLAVKSTVSGADGTFTMEGIQSGDYRLEYVRKGRTVRSSVKLALGDEGGSWRRELSLPTGAVVGRVLAKGTDGPLEGVQVKLTRLAGAGGGTVRNMRVQVMMVGGSGRRMPGLGLGGGKEPQVRTDAEGRFRIEEVPPGSWQVELWKEGADRPALTRKIQVDEGRKTAAGDLRLDPERGER